MLQPLAVEIHHDTSSCRKTVENTIKSLSRKNIDGALTTLRGQVAGLRETEEKTDRMIKLANQSDETVNETQKRLERLESVANKVVPELDALKRNLATWQSASDFENNLATYIYPPDTKVTFGPIFTTLMRWLAKNNHTKEGKEAHEKWSELQRKAKFQWTKDHENMLQKMLECRKIKFDLSFSNEETERYKEILFMNDFIKLN